MDRTQSMWFWSVLSAVVAGGLGVSINFATDLRSSLLAWILVGAFTLAAGAATAGSQVVSRRAESGRTGDHSRPATVGLDVGIDGDHNTISAIGGNRNQVIYGNVHRQGANGWLVFLVLGVSSVVMAAVLIGINVVTPAPGGNSQQEQRIPAAAPGSAEAEGSSTLAVAASWPLITGCSALTQVAMPAGRGGIHDFHAVTDIRSNLIAAGAGAWTNGLLYLDMSTINGKSIHIQNISPKRIRRDLASPAWIFAPDDGCGPPPESRLFSYNLDSGAFKDEGTPNSDPSRPSPGIPTAQLGSGFVVSEAEHAIVQISTLSCHGNYEWNLDIQYVVTGADTVEHYTAGPFQSYGAASNTTVYRGHQDKTGVIQIDDVSTLTGNDPQVPC